MTLQNDNLLRALRCQPVDRIPLWIMRQAGRYLPEYRAVRAKAGDFMTLCKTPELACEVTLQPLERFDLDAAILFSDILTIPDAMGLGLHFIEGEGPKFHRPIQTLAQIDALKALDIPTDLGYVTDAIRLIKHELADKVPLIGFSGSPWTLACYMIEGGPSKQFAQIKRWLYGEPDGLHRLLAHLTQSITAYLQAQINAGVDVIMLFDSWGGILSTPAYQAFSLSYLQTIIQNLKTTTDIPIILFTKGGSLWLESLAESGAHALGLDWTIDLTQARARVGQNIALQGNLDPCVLLSNPAAIKQETQRILDQTSSQTPGFIFNLGHGILPQTPPEHVQALVEQVHGYRG
jgi:uroporphyrinogen decarboxylase